MPTSAFTSKSHSNFSPPLTILKNHSLNELQLKKSTPPDRLSFLKTQDESTSTSNLFPPSHSPLNELNTELSPPLPLQTQGEGETSNVNGENGGGEETQLVDENGESYVVKFSPPDGDWGWLVLVSSIMINILIPGTVKSSGVLLVEFIDVFKVTPMTASFVPAISFGFYSFMGLFAYKLAATFSFRIVTMLGGLLAAIGLCSCYYATHIFHLYICYGFIGGIGAGLCYPIGIWIVSLYFDKKRGLANGLCTSGSALGSIVMPILIQHLLNSYGYRVCIMSIGIMLLNVCFAAILYDPVEMHHRKLHVYSDGRVIDVTKPSFCSKLRLRYSNWKRRRSPNNAHQPPSSETQNLFINRPSSGCGSSSPIEIPSKECLRRGSGSQRRAFFHIGHEESSSYKSNEGSPSVGRLLREDVKLRREERGGEQEVLYTGSHFIHSNGTVETVPPNYSRLNLTAIPEEQGTSNHKGTQSYRTPKHYNQGCQVSSTLTRTGSLASHASVSSFRYISTIHHGSSLSALQNEFLSPPPLPPPQRRRTDCGKGCLGCLKFSLVWCGILKDLSLEGVDTKERPFVDLTLLKDGIFIVMLVSSALSAIGYTNFIILLPSYALTLGFDRQVSSSLLSVVAGLDFVGRIGGAALSDLNLFSKEYYFMAGLFFSGLTLSFFSLAKGYWPIIIFCAFFGLASGTYIGVTAVILADRLGSEKLSSSYGLTMVANGVFQVAGPPLCGIIYQIINSYEPIFLGLGLILLLGSSVWIAVPFIDKRREEERVNLLLTSNLTPPPQEIIKNPGIALVEEEEGSSKKEGGGGVVA